ncbi:TRAP transporter small permease subunit [Wenxinia saemankumensis]|uniref:TRAP transporter small permease protein n=1 Tax=Wenxinia saemankumensis TaxID=1447782 RepID=A0A1M6AIT4_9RHOB|nr:TRAP transporter small permease subunit [Wenxinia saemankumensis]SHI36238.1 hypothetical protein SAMN05444417_0450 [Wenxinia saemankumensis]
MEDEVAAAGFWPTYENAFTRFTDRLMGATAESVDGSVEVTGGALVAIWNAILYVIGGLIEVPYNVAYAIFHPGDWLAWVPNVTFSGSMPDQAIAESLMRFVYFAASKELFFFLLFVFLVITIVGYVRTGFLWGMVRGLEGFGNAIGRVAAWAGLLMVLQQIVVIFMQRVFAVSEISLGFGSVFTKDVSWWSEELKLYNAAVVALCVAYTFVQGGHVRVDLVYSPISFRAKKVVDMVGSLLFMVPAAMLIWLYAWFFLWRHLVVPNPSASESLDRLLNKARALRWNIETISFSPNGFNGYFLFKVLLCLFVVLVFLQACAFFWRSWLEYREGETSADRYRDFDREPEHSADLAAPQRTH